jgi:anaerobic selenocysteine-containing dehydrogenase
MHPDSARRFDLEDGDMAYIETNKGRIVQRLAFNDDLDPRVVIASFGWWFPERSGNLFGWDESNINVLTRSEPPYDPGIGTFEIRGIPCRVGPLPDRKARSQISGGAVMIARSAI